MLAGVLALLVAALFTGAALYVSLVVQPARLRLDDVSLLAEWRASSMRASFVQAALAIVGFALGIVAGQQRGNWLWFFGGIILFAHWPYTALWVTPQGRQIAGYLPEKTEIPLRVLVAKWGRLHAARTALGALACLIFVSAIAQGLARP